MELKVATVDEACQQVEQLRKQAIDKPVEVLSRGGGDDRTKDDRTTETRLKG